MLFNGKYYNKPGHLGMTRAELLEKLNEGGNELENAQKISTPLIVYTAAEMATVLGGTAVVKTLDSLDGFVVEDNEIIKYPFYLPIEGEGTTGLIMTSLAGVALDGGIAYHILLQALGETYLTAVVVKYVTDHIQVQVTARQLT